MIVDDDYSIIKSLVENRAKLKMDIPYMIDSKSFEVKLINFEETVREARNNYLASIEKYRKPENHVLRDGDIAIP